MNIQPLFKGSGRKIQQLVRDATPMYATPQTLVERIEKAAATDAIVIDWPLLPEGYYSPANLLKRGKGDHCVHLGLENDIEKIIEAAEKGTIKGPTRTRNEQFRTLPGGPLFGYTWSTPNGQELHHVTLTHCIEGRRLWHLCTKDDASSVKIKGYHSTKEVRRWGMTFNVEVPSFSGKESYEFQMVHVPVENVPEQHVTWRHMKPKGHMGGKKVEGRQEGCEFTYWGELTHARPQPVQHCLHAVIAHSAISECVRRQNGHIILQPYALPNQNTVDYYKKVCRQVVVEEKMPNTKGWHRLQRRHPNLMETEALLWEFVFAHRRDTPAPLYAGTSLRIYNWE